MGCGIKSGNNKFEFLVYSFSKVTFKDLALSNAVDETVFDTVAITIDCRKE